MSLDRDDYDQCCCLAADVLCDKPLRCCDDDQEWDHHTAALSHLIEATIEAYLTEWRAVETKERP